MEFIGIVSIISLLGAIVTAALAHRFLGFRESDEPEMGLLSASGGLRTVDDLVAQLDRLHGQTMRLEEQLRERDHVEEIRWRMLEESQAEVRKLRSAYVGLRNEFERRISDSDESRRLRERELERRQERGFERHRERELEQSGFRPRKSGPLVSVR